MAEHCLYGVDLNPLAVELGKLALWMHTIQRDKALSFLDHHIRCGNSLVSAQLRYMGEVPELKKLNEKERRKKAGALSLPPYMEPLENALKQALKEYHEILAAPSDTAAQVHEKEDRLDRARSLLAPFREAADVWTSALFGNPLDKTEWDKWSAKIGTTADGDAPAFVSRATELAQRFNLFHTFLEFPEVYFEKDINKKDSNGNGPFSRDAGFDAIIMNPPWERVKLQENEFFAQRDEAIALAPTAAKRKTMIAALAKKNPTLRKEYESAKEKADDTLAFLHGSGQFPLMGRGDTNYYSVFAELALNAVAPGGRIGMVTPSGIATDKGAEDFFGQLVGQKRIVSLVDFENRRAHFADVHRSFKYTISILSGPGTATEEFECGFYLLEPEELKEEGRLIRLTPEDIALVNPNTKTCPVFRTQRDADLTRAIYRRVPVLLLREGKRETNHWGIKFSTMFHMTNDSGLFMTAAELKKEGYWLGEGNVFQKGKSKYLPLYEGKMVQMYDHRAARVVVNPKNLHRPAVPESLTDKEKAKPGTLASPQFWVDGVNVAERLGEWDRGWMYCFKDITSPTNQRTMICSLIPRTAVGNKLPVVLSPKHEMYPALVSNFSSFVFDFVARQKLGGQTLNFFIVEQLPVLPPKDYEKPLQKGKKATVADFIRPRVLELVYTANDMEAFALDMGHKGKPFKWDPERRLHLQCQLDALFFHLYGLSHDDADYVMGTFPIVREKDEKQYGGRYRTRDLILDYYNAYAAGDWDAQVKG